MKAISKIFVWQGNVNGIDTVAPIGGNGIIVKSERIDRVEVTEGHIYSEIHGYRPANVVVETPGGTFAWDTRRYGAARDGYLRNPHIPKGVQNMLPAKIIEWLE